MEAWTDMRAPALAIVARGDQIEAASPVDWTVRSQSDPSKAYRVSVRRDRWMCECAYFTDAAAFCIHILAVRFQNDLRASLGAFFKFAEILPIVQRTLGDATSCQLVTITV